MGIVASKADNRYNNNTQLLNLCKERKESIRSARDARYHLAKSHLSYFESLLRFTNALDTFVRDDLIVIPYSSDDDDSSSNNNVSVCCETDSDSSNDHSQTVPLSKDHDMNQGELTCGSRNDVQVGLGFEDKEFVSAPIVDRGLEKTCFIEQSSFPALDIFGLYGFADNTQFVFADQRDDEADIDVWREVREREGIPYLEYDSEHDHSLIRKNRKTKNKKKKNVQESSLSANNVEVDKREMKFNGKETTLNANVVSDVNKRDVEASLCNGKLIGEVKDSSENCAQETPKHSKEACDEACESSSSSCCFSDSSCSGSTDLRIIVEKINCISEIASSNSEVYELLEVSKVLHQQPLGDQFKGYASRVFGSSRYSNSTILLLKGGLREDDLVGSLSMTLEKLYTWEKKLYAEVTIEEKLRISYDRSYTILKNLDQKGAEASEIYEAEAVVKLHLSKIDVSLRTIESISMRIHKIRDKELWFQVVGIINGFKKMWRFLANCHHKQFLAIKKKSKSCVHIVEKGSSSRKAAHKVEERIRRYKESLRGYIDAQRGFVKYLNEWLNRNIMTEDDETEIEAPKIFRVCGEWLREIAIVDETRVLRVVEEMESSFLGLGVKQVEEAKQRMKTERFRKEMERKTKEAEEIRKAAVDFPASDSLATAKKMVESELLSLRESVTQEKEKHERMMRELNDAVSMSLQECLVHVFEALEEFCYGNYKAYQNIRIVSKET
ncbi:unnamed protein product [Cochlearia groenlandica]